MGDFKDFEKTLFCYFVVDEYYEDEDEDEKLNIHELSDKILKREIEDFYEFVHEDDFEEIYEESKKRNIYSEEVKAKVELKHACAKRVKLMSSKEESLKLIRECYKTIINNLIKTSMDPSQNYFDPRCRILNKMMEMEDFDNITKLKEYMIKDMECKEDIYWTLSFFKTECNYKLSSYPPFKTDIVKHVFETFDYEKKDFTNGDDILDYEEMEIYRSSDEEAKRYIQEYISQLG